MKKSYAINPEDYSLERFFELTRSRTMLPGRVVLHDSIDERLLILNKEGIKNLNDLFSALKSKDKILELSQRSGIPESYLVILKREAASYISKPVKLNEFPGIPIEYVLSLESKGIKNSRSLFEAVQAEKKKSELSKSTGIPTDRLDELFSLCDLVRINGVGGVFARILYETGIQSVEQLIDIDFDKSYAEFTRISKLRNYANISFSESDIEFCMVYAKELLTL